VPNAILVSLGHFFPEYFIFLYLIFMYLMYKYIFIYLTHFLMLLGSWEQSAEAEEEGSEEAAAAERRRPRPRHFRGTFY
jgi:hypothetical protein